MLGEMVSPRVASLDLRAAQAGRRGGCRRCGPASVCLVQQHPCLRPSVHHDSRLYDVRAMRYQDPDMNACAAAAAQIMLNTIALKAEQDTIMVGPDRSRWSVFLWQTDTTYARQTSILAYERANMTMLTSSPGTDPHGWRNALNFYGWGTTAAGVYRDSAYDSFDEAARAVAISVTRYGRPVGILARSGRHAQIVTGVVVTGGDPRLRRHLRCGGRLHHRSAPIRVDARLLRCGLLLASPAGRYRSASSRTRRMIRRTRTRSTAAWATPSGKASG